MRNGTSRQVTLLIVVDSISLGFTAWMPTICIPSMLVLVRKCQFDVNIALTRLQMLVALQTGLCLGSSIDAARRAWFHFSRLELNLPTCAEFSNVQPENACDKENDDDDADDVENVHGVLRLRQTRFQMKARRSNRKRPGPKVSSVLGNSLRLD